jgi:uncharacterized SAM-binding protein YcdF (DUF218 family)
VIDPDIRPHVERLWHYHRLGHDLRPADAILVLCSHDIRVADRGAQLFLDGWAPLLIFSGGLGAITSQLWREPEAELFARVAVQMGVPPQRILIEPNSSNTGENVRFTRALLAERGLDLHSLIVVHKPYMERRSYATLKKVWPELEPVVTSPQVTLDEYLGLYTNDSLSAADVIGIMVGDLQRIRIYPEKGFQIPQPIPDDVWASYEALVASGYGTRLVT